MRSRVYSAVSPNSEVLDAPRLLLGLASTADQPGEVQVKTLMRLMIVASVALMPALVFAGPAAAEEGGNKVTVAVCKESGLTGAVFRNRGQCVTSVPKQPQPGPAFSLELDQGQHYDCNPPSPTMQCWGILSGSGLAPFSVVHVIGNGRGFNGTHATVMEDGTVSVDLSLPCNVHTVRAQGTLPTSPPTVTDPTAAVDPPDPCPGG
jgi:hypothetical protein